MNSGAPIDVFGVGTKLAVIADAPDLDMAYKLVEYGGKGRLKLSTNKLLYPGRKQVFRRIDKRTNGGRCDWANQINRPRPGPIHIAPPSPPRPSPPFSLGCVPSSPKLLPNSSS